MKKKRLVKSKIKCLRNFHKSKQFFCYRDNVYRLTLHSLVQLEHASWTAPPEKIKVCQDKGQSSADCHNFIKVLLSNGKRLFACGTNAFSPQCTWREVKLAFFGSGFDRPTFSDSKKLVLN